MPWYEYYSDDTDEVKEVYHGPNEKPEVRDSKGNIMRRSYSAFTLVMGKDNSDSTKTRKGNGN